MTRTLMIAAAVAALVVGTLAVVLANSGDDTAATPSSPPPSAPTSAGPTGEGLSDPTSDRLGRKVLVPNNPAGQPLPQRDPLPRNECRGGTSVTSPDSVTIQRSYGMPVLVSATDGPARIDGTALVGYRQSPQGAALAAWNFIARIYAGGTPGREALIKLAVLSDADKARLTQAPVSSVPNGGDQFRRLFIAPDQFRVLSCDREFAAIELALQLTPDSGGRRQWAGIRMNLLWRNGDWKVQTTQDPHSLGGGQKYSSLDGWTPWAS
jgi:hypothetical protein